MLYYLFTWLRENFNLLGAGVFYYITFRTALAVILSLLISMVFGKRIINFIRRKQIGETVRDLGLQGEAQKQGTPTMGGLIILAAILIPTLLLARVLNVYVMLMIISTVWLGLVGFLDDYIKVFRKNKEGLSGRFKIMGQVGLGIIVGLTMYYNDYVVVSRDVTDNANPVHYGVDALEPGTRTRLDGEGKEHRYVRVRSATTTVPFVKDHEFHYAGIARLFGEKAVEVGTPFIYILFVTFIIVAVSNGANMTDGVDGLAAGVSAIAGICLGVFAYVSGNYIFANYLGIMHIPNLSELSIFIGAFVGACVGFLWYNAYPAQVFMGDTGSLALGGIIASLAIIVRKELLVPIICGIFLVENISVMMQVSYFKYTKKRTGEGKRILLMAPLHHHYQKMGYHESKIVTRFWIIAIMLSILSIVTLKLQ
ncbi:MAG: phospho-N-acetylmuramoyl-pentapeptide-transferase [Sphingobacteriales bacterium]|nr:MAG: phospho-N-acetylmuramoyl-pentapeptide-transferase [Sphingobacteriales bacterium]